MAIVKKFRMNLYVDYTDTEDEERWMGESEYKVTMVDGKPAVVDTLHPNIAIHPLSDLVNDLEEVLNDSLDELQKYKDLEIKAVKQ